MNLIVQCVHRPSAYQFNIKLYCNLHTSSEWCISTKEWMEEKFLLQKKVEQR